MMDLFKNISLSLTIALALNASSIGIESDFLPTFLSENLITLLIALFAINITTLSVIMTKLSEISNNEGSDFSTTIREMKHSITEQCFLIIIGISAVQNILCGVIKA